MPETPSDVFIPYWMRGTSLERKYIDLWTEFPLATSQTILSMLRDDPVWDQEFPGNRYPDGSPIHSEDQYRAIEASFRDTLLSVNVNPNLFQNRFAELIQGFVSPQEFTQRVETVYTRVMDSSPAIRNYYASNFAEDMTDSAIMASFLDPDIGMAILNKEIAMSEVGGEASQRGFGIGVDFAKTLVNAGLDQQSEAAQFFSLAEGMLPALNALATRHADPDDDFDLMEFTQAQIFNDPEQRRRLRRLAAQERSDFSSGAGDAGVIRRSNTGLAVGLTER